jgi:hypothetical protein
VLSLGAARKFLRYSLRDLGTMRHDSAMTMTGDDGTDERFREYSKNSASIRSPFAGRQAGLR